MSFTVVQPMGDLVKNLENHTKNTRKKSGEFLDLVASEHAQFAQIYGAEDTGEMVGSVQVEHVSDDRVDVVSYSQQGIFNEFGTVYMNIGSAESPLPVISTSGKNAYRPWFRPAGLRVLENVNKYVRQIFGR